jgi:Transposase DNA-binding/Transposase DDE domain
MTSHDVPDARSEFESANFGDLRLTRRLMRMAERAAALPSAGFPQIVKSDGELEGVYRFLGNARVTPARILAPHMAATLVRARGRDVVVAHDTTELKFGGALLREGLGRIRNEGGAQGFFAHFALAVARDGRRPLGVLGLKTFVRPWRVPTRSKADRDRTLDNETLKWIEVASDVSKSLPDAVHVMDREADSYAILAPLTERSIRFVIRLCRDKKLLGHSEKLFAAAARAPIYATRSVPISRRARTRCETLNKIHPPRAERTAKLRLRAASFDLPRPKRPKYRTGFPALLRVNVVTVDEVDVPGGEEPICWQLVTTEPIANAAQVEAIVDAYRMRWAIEEFFKALKTGCAFEKRQLESYATLVNALAMFAVIAWRLLLLRFVARTEPDSPATAALTERQVRVLQALSTMPDAPVHVDIPTVNPTARDALLAVARLGGHLENNGAPGWLVLGRGLESLLLIELGWRARDSAPRARSQDK